MRSARDRGIPKEEYQEVSYPHPYLLIWIDCKRHGNPMTGVAALPEPEKGILDQDAELLLAFEILEELYKTHEEEEEQRKRLREESSTRLGLQH